MGVVIFSHFCCVLLMVFCGCVGEDFGTVLFGESDVQRTCYGSEEIAMITARMMLEDLVPHLKKAPLIEDNEYITDVVDYFRLILEVVRNRTVGKGRHVMLLALTDTLGGYMNKFLVPSAKLSYYAGKINYNAVIKLLTLFNELKAFLRTSGLGWAKPEPPKNLQAQALTVPMMSMSSTACRGLIFYRRYTNVKGEINCFTQPTVVIPMPFFDSKSHPSAMAVPFKIYTLRNLESKSAAYVLVKFYVAASKCFLSQNAEEQSFCHFESDLLGFLERKVLPHLKDDKFYSAFGGVLRIVQTLKDKGVRASSEEEYNQRIAAMNGTKQMEPPLSEETTSSSEAGLGSGSETASSGTQAVAATISAEAKKRRSNIILFAALVTIFFWFLIGAFFICCKMRAAKLKNKQMDGDDAESGKTSSTTKTVSDSISGSFKKASESFGFSKQASKEEQDTETTENTTNSTADKSNKTNLKGWLGRCVPSSGAEDGEADRDSFYKKQNLFNKIKEAKTGSTVSDTTKSENSSVLNKSACGTERGERGAGSVSSAGKTGLLPSLFKSSGDHSGQKINKSDPSVKNAYKKYEDCFCPDRVKAEAEVKGQRISFPTVGKENSIVKFDLEQQQQQQQQQQQTGGVPPKQAGDSSSLEDSGDDFATGSSRKRPDKYYSPKFACHTSLAGRYMMSNTPTSEMQTSSPRSGLTSPERRSSADPKNPVWAFTSTFNKPQDTPGHRMIYDHAGTPVTELRTALFSEENQSKTEDYEEGYLNMRKCNSNSKSKSSSGNLGGQGPGLGQGQGAGAGGGERKVPLVFGYDFNTTTTDETSSDIDDSLETAAKELYQIGEDKKSSKQSLGEGENERNDEEDEEEEIIQSDSIEKMIIH